MTIERNTVEHSIQAAFEWLIKSIEATKGQGSAAYFHIFNGWSESYPETTGYIIDTLFDGHRFLGDEKLKINALDCADWLCEIQQKDGSFLSGVGGTMSPIIFDNGMIVMGLFRAISESQNEAYKKALELSMEWLSKQIGQQDFKKEHAYIANYSPLYNSMVIWSMARANKYLHFDGINEKLNELLNKASKDLKNGHIIYRSSFRPNEPAFTHTIGYTLQGVLEAGLLLNNGESTSIVEKQLIQIIKAIYENGKIAGSYFGNWQGDYSFECLTGNAQLSIVFYRAYELTEKEEYLIFANNLLFPLLNKQHKFPIAGIKGGVAGSFPIWGKYQRFRFPNWAVKFFIDACLLSIKNN